MTGTTKRLAALALLTLMMGAVNAAQLVREFRELGFQYVTVDLQGFRSGSLNEVLVREDVR